MEAQPTSSPSTALTEQDLSPDQKKAFDRILEWFACRNTQELKVRQLSLGGYAGTGKTTLLRLLVDRADCDVAVMSLTGKAVSVLIRKGMDAATIHSTIYHFHLEKKKPVFTLRSHIEDNPDLLIIDEASMVPTDVYKDLLSFKIPILWVGDHGQLEPVGKNPEVMLSPDIRLEKIHRQAEGNPIIMFADGVRRGNAPAAMAMTKYKPQVLVIRKGELRESELLTADQIICAFNHARVRINKGIRRELKHPVNRPTVGDRVICLKNQRQLGIFNGLQGVIQEIIPDSKLPMYYAKIELDTGRVYEGEILAKQFNHVKGLIEVPKELSKCTYWDYCYAVTCHKAQGSEWPFVVVIEESCPLWSAARWAYTAVTRASERLVYAC